jgi:hypothetical protein
MLCNTELATPNSDIAKSMMKGGKKGFINTRALLIVSKYIIKAKVIMIPSLPYIVYGFRTIKNMDRNTIMCFVFFFIFIKLI